MNKPGNDEIEFISKCLGEGKQFPDSYRYILPFETKKGYEHTYEGEDREENIRADRLLYPILIQISCVYLVESRGFLNPLYKYKLIIDTD